MSRNSLLEAGAIFKVKVTAGIRTQNHLVRKGTLNHLAKLATQLNHLAGLAKWLSVRLRLKWLWVRIKSLQWESFWLKHSKEQFK